MKEKEINILKNLEQIDIDAEKVGQTLMAFYNQLPYAAIAILVSVILGMTN